MNCVSRVLWEKQDIRQIKRRESNAKRFKLIKVPAKQKTARAATCCSSGQKSFKFHLQNHDKNHIEILFH